MKSVLLDLVAAIENLEANLAVIAAYVPHPPTISAARNAKNLTMQQHAKKYAQLRQKIEELPFSE